MKRFLAAILTISICLSVMAFLPTASAANENETVYDFTAPKVINIELNDSPWYSGDNWEGFDFSDNLKDFYTGVTNKTITSYTFADGETTYTTTDTYGDEKLDTLANIKVRAAQMYQSYLRFSPSVRFNIKTGCPVLAHFSDSWVALKLDAPTTRGEHELTLNWHSDTSVAYGCDVFFAPYVEGQEDGDYYITNGEQLCADTKFNYATSATNTLEKKVNIGDASHYILIFRLDKYAYTNRIALSNITLTKDETAAPTTVNYGVFDNIEDSDAVTVTGGENNKLFGSVTAGTGISATAGEKEGYTFRYWVLGSAATGRYYSSEKTVTINPYANIALTAIYTEATEDTKYLDFFNWNGEFVDSKEVTDGKVTALPTQPTLTGYSFLNWILEDNKTTFTDATVEIPESISKAMAQYTAVDDYDQAVQNNGSVKGWTRNGELVTYSENYEFFTWLNDVGTIAAYTGEEISDEIPLAVLESDGGENFMLEYDKGAYTIKEAGILFGKTANVNVESAYSKATAKYLEEDGHGQLTAAPEGDKAMELYARGYVMYNDKVIYTEAIEVK